MFPETENNCCVVMKHALQNASNVYICLLYYITILNYTQYTFLVKLACSDN
jgi:hypothetical protein